MKEPAVASSPENEEDLVCIKSVANPPVVTLPPSLTRTSVSESEPNANPTQATALPTTGWPHTVSGSISSSGSAGDNDWYSMSLTGGGTSVDNVTVGFISYTGTLWVTIFGFYPSGNDQLLYDSEVAGYGIPLQIDASYTGTYYIRVYNDDTAGSYSFTVSKTSVTPVDNYNDMASALDVTSLTSRTGEYVADTWDPWDWYTIDAPDHMNYESNLSVTCTVTGAFNYAYSATIIFFSEAFMFIMYEKKDTPGTYVRAVYGVSNNANSPYNSPVTGYIEGNFTKAYVGILTQTRGIDTTNPNAAYSGNGPLQNGYVNYNLGWNMKALIPNTPPKLMNGSVTPGTGRTSDSYTYSVTYRDINNDPPGGIDVIIDGTDSKPMTKKAGQGSDYITGVVYEATIWGTDPSLGEGSHTFNFSAHDGEDVATKGIQSFDGPVIDDNNAPVVKSGITTFIQLHEDRGPQYLNLANFFEDIDGDTMSFTLWSGTAWGISLDTDLCGYEINTLNSTLKIDLAQDQYGEETIQLNVTDGKVWVNDPLTLTINISEINDPPEITTVGGKNVLAHSVNIDSVEDQWTNLTVEASDPIDGDPLIFDSDIKTALFAGKSGENYDFDVETGELHFKPSDREVDAGGMTVNLSCNDGRGGVDWVILNIAVANSNDLPVLNNINDKTVNQFAWLNFTMKASDLDSNSGDELTFFTNISDAIPNVDEIDDVSLDVVTGEFAFHAIHQEQVGEWDVAFGVRDLAGAEKVQTVKVTIKNVNEKPVAGPVTWEGGTGNLTVTVMTDAAFDPDGDVLTYIWDFDDATPKVEGVDLTTATYNYTYPGTYNISLSVTDGFLTTPPQVVTVKVTEPGSVDSIPTEVFSSLDPDDMGSSSVKVTFDICKMIMTTEEDGDETVATTKYEFSGTCGSDVEVIHLYWGTQIDDGDYTLTPFYNPKDLEHVVIEPDLDGTWSKKITYELRYPTPDPVDTEPPDDAGDPPKVVVWFAAVGWTEEGEYGMAKAEAETSSGGGGGGSTTGSSGSSSTLCILIIVIIALVLIGVILVVVVVVVKKSGKKKKDEAEQPPPPEAAQQPEMAAAGEPVAQPMPEPTPAFSQEEQYPLPEPAPAPYLEGEGEQPQLPDYQQPALPPPSEISVDAPPDLHEEPPMDGDAADAVEEPAAEGEAPPAPETPPEEDLDALFSDINAEEAAQAAQAQPEAPAPEPETSGPAFGEGLPIEEVPGEGAVAAAAEEAPAAEQQPQDELAGETLEVSCHNCGELMAVEITQRPQVIVCWNCQAEGMIE